MTLGKWLTWCTNTLYKMCIIIITIIIIIIINITLHQLIKTKTSDWTTYHEKSGVYITICNTCQNSYAEQTSRNLKSRSLEHTHYIRNNDPHSAYALNILNCRHEYGNINDIMTLLKQINKPSLLLYKQMYIQLFDHSNKLIPKRHLNKHNLIF